MFPEKWITAEEKIGRDSNIINDNGILCLIGDSAEEYLYFENKPPEMEARR